MSELNKITQSLTVGGGLDTLLRQLNPDMLSISASNKIDLQSQVSSNESIQTDIIENENAGYSNSKNKRQIPGNAARERSRVKTLRSAFQDLQKSLPSVPPDTKLSKLDVLVLATTYIGHLMRTLEEGNSQQQSQVKWGDTVNSHLCNSLEKTLWPTKGYFHPVKKWPMRSRLFAGMTSGQKESTLEVKLNTNICAPHLAYDHKYGNIDINSKSEITSDTRQMYENDSFQSVGEILEGITPQGVKKRTHTSINEDLTITPEFEFPSTTGYPRRTTVIAGLTSTEGNIKSNITIPHFIQYKH